MYRESVFAVERLEYCESSLGVWREVHQFYFSQCNCVSVCPDGTKIRDLWSGEGQLCVQDREEKGIIIILIITAQCA